MSVVHINWGPNKLIHVEPAGVKWCFGCRKHLLHVLEVWVDDPPSYYEPTPVLCCSRCHRDRTWFGS